MPGLLEKCHSKLKNLIGNAMEPFSVIERVEQHRSYWRPDVIRVVLLAESHVYTLEDELQHVLCEPPDLPPDLPRGFVRLVYCLGYGEDSCLNRRIAGSRNSGTPQFWKVFYSCVNSVSRNDEFVPVQASRTPDCEQRIRNKLRLLEQLRADGVWLVDASIAALYRPQQKKLSPSLLKKAIQASWDDYTSKLVADSNAKAILCIGKGVEQALHTRLDSIGIPWATLYQPNAHLSTVDHLRNFARYREVCANPDSINSIRS